MANHPYSGLSAAIGTMHQKELAIGPVLRRWFGIELQVAPDLDTDSLGTFTGEIPRAGTMLEAARAKACLAIERTGAALGIGSEGSFGPDPHIPFVASGLEMLVLREAISGHEIVVHRRTRTNYDNLTVSPGDDITTFLRRVEFPGHAVVVRSEASEDTSVVFKGLTELRDVHMAIENIATRSPSGRAMIQTDMRAHLNPTRMGTLGRLARGLAVRMARRCPHCGEPGFGITDVERGLACRDCGSPTHLIRAEIHSCQSCGHRVLRRERGRNQWSDPMWCQECNP